MCGNANLCFLLIVQSDPRTGGLDVTNLICPRKEISDFGDGTMQGASDGEDWSGSMSLIQHRVVNGREEL